MTAKAILIIFIIHSDLINYKLVITLQPATGAIPLNPFRP